MMHNNPHLLMPKASHMNLLAFPSNCLNIEPIRGYEYGNLNLRTTMKTKTKTTHVKFNPNIVTVSHAHFYHRYNPR